MTALNWERARRKALISRNKKNSHPVPLDVVPPGVTGFRGVHMAKDKNKYRAVIEVCGHRMHLGYFRTAMAAAHAYDLAAIKAWGHAAILNFGREAMNERVCVHTIRKHVFSLTPSHTKKEG